MVADKASFPITPVLLMNKGGLWFEATPPQ